MSTEDLDLPKGIGAPTTKAPVVPPVGATALGAAMMRAAEGLRPDRLFEDPYATAFVAAGPRVFEDVADAGDGELDALEELFGAAVVIRTRFFDDWLAAACASGTQQVVLLAAGLDTRAFRLEWPRGTRVFELDLPNVLAFKDIVLREQDATPRCDRRLVPVDLRTDWPSRLTTAGFEAAAGTAWLAEGLLTYLSDEEVGRLLSDVTMLSRPGDQLSFEPGGIGDDSLLSQAAAVPSLHEVTSLWHGGAGQDAVSWLVAHDWRVESYERAALASSYGRRMPAGTTGGFVTATLGDPGQPA